MGNLTITPLNVTVTADDITKSFGDVDPELTFVSDPAVDTPLANGDTITFSGSLVRDLGESVGTYAIKQGTLSLSSNYILSFESGDFNIVCSNAPVIKSFATAIGSGASKPPKIDKPTGTKAGDLLIAGLMFEKGGSVTPGAPTGWTLIQRTNQGNNVGMATYYKIAGSSEPSTYTFSLSSGPKWSIGISRIEGADPTNPIDANNGAFGGPSSKADAPSITSTVCNALVMAFYTNKKDATWTAAPGTTEVYDKPNNQQGLTSNMMAYYVQPAEGATGTKTATASIAEYWVAQQVAVRPVPNRTGSISGRVGDAAESNDTFEEVPLFESQDADVHAYPNPVHDRVIIQIDGITQAPASSDIYILDRVGKTYPVNSAWDSQNSALEIDFARMGPGMYFIKVNTEHGNKSVRVVKATE